MPWDILLIFFLLAVILPWRSRARMKKLLGMPHVSSKERLVLYASTIAIQWLAVAAVAWRAWAHGYTAPQLGLTLHPQTRLVVAGILGGATFALLQWLNLRRVGRVPIERRGLLQNIAERILPQSAIERIPYLALAITAGLCEEFLYRGFGMAVFSRLGLQAWEVVLFCSLRFFSAWHIATKGAVESS